MFLARRPRRPQSTPLALSAPFQRKPHDTAAHPARGYRAHWHRAPLRFLPLVVLLVAIWACGGTPVVVTTHKPAAQLWLALSITGQYRDQPTVTIGAELFEGMNQQAVALPQHARLTCNGSDIVPSIQSGTHTCPRQPPGGAYHIAFTDEHGATTTVTVPVPTSVFAILSPQPGAHVPIPTNGALPVRFSTPLPAAQASVSVSVIAGCGSEQYSCGAVQGTLDAPPATPTVANGSGSVVGTPTPDTLSCPPSSLLNSPLVTMRGNQGTFTVTGDFGTFQPGPGSIELNVAMCLSPDPAGFAAVRASFSDSLSAAITWVR